MRRIGISTKNDYLLDGPTTDLKRHEKTTIKCIGRKLSVTDGIKSKCENKQNIEILIGAGCLRWHESASTRDKSKMIFAAKKTRNIFFGDTRFCSIRCRQTNFCPSRSICIYRPGSAASFGSWWDYLGPPGLGIRGLPAVLRHYITEILSFFYRIEIYLWFTLQAPSGAVRPPGINQSVTRARLGDYCAPSPPPIIAA